MLSNRRVDRSTALFITLVVVAFILMTFDVRSSQGGVVDTLREGARTLASPLQKAVDTVTRPITDFVDGVVNLAGYRAENEELRRQLEDAERRLAEAEAVFTQNEELRLLLNLGLPAELDRRVARVQAGGGSNFDHSVVIDQGRADGVGIDMPVINGRGLIGRVVGVTDHSATVLLITDPSHSVRVRVVDTADRGTVTGRGGGPLSLLVSNAAFPVEAGQLVMTDPGRYPADLLVGTIEESATPQSGFVLQTTVHPAVDFDRLDFVTVLLYTGSDAPGESSTTTTTTVPPTGSSPEGTGGTAGP